MIDTNVRSMFNERNNYVNKRRYTMKGTNIKETDQAPKKHIFSSLYDLISNVFTFFADIFKSIFGIFTQAFNTMKDKASDAYQTFKEGVAGEVLKQGVNETINKCKDTSNSVKNAFQSAINEVGGLGESVKNTCTNFVKEGINQITTLFNNTIDGSNKAIQKTMKTNKSKTLVEAWTNYFQGKQGSNTYLDDDCERAVNLYSDKNGSITPERKNELKLDLKKILAKTSVKKEGFSQNDKSLVGYYYDAKLKEFKNKNSTNTGNKYTRRLENFVTYVKRNSDTIKERVKTNPYYQTTSILGNLVNSVFNALRPKSLISGQVEKCVNSASIIGNAIITALSLHRVDTSANRKENTNNSTITNSKPSR